MPKKTTAIRAVTDPVLPMDEIKKLSLKEACARFAERATVSQRAFAEMGKLHNAISACLKKGQTIYGELRKLGVKDSTISNASYASKVVDLVKAGHVTEPQYDGFTFADCLAICRVMGDKSQRKLTGEDVAAVIVAAPETFDAEFESIFATGLNIEEETARAKKQADEAAQAEAEAKAEAERKAAEKAEAEKQTAIAAALEKERLEREAANTPPANTPETGVPEIPASETAAPEPPNAESAAPEQTVEPADETPAPAPEPPAPSNVSQLPPDPDTDLEAVLADLDNLREEVSTMSVEAKKTVFAKLNEFMAHLDSQINPPVADAA